MMALCYFMFTAWLLTMTFFSIYDFFAYCFYKHKWNKQEKERLRRGEEGRGDIIGDIYVDIFLDNNPFL